MRRIVLALLAIAAVANGADLTIVSGGRRIIDPDPSSAATNCRGWSYGAMPVADASGAITTIYSASDLLTNHCAEPLSSAGHFGDRIWRHTLGADGTWSGAPIIGREAFPWLANPEASSAVGHLSSPAVVRIDGRWYMAFTASVSDPNLCAGEHAAATTCGSCSDPWSHFAMMWAVSDDGEHWRVRGGSGANANPALDAALLWREPSPADRAPTSVYKALSRVSMLTVSDAGKTYFYILGVFWSRVTPKPAMFRIAYDASNSWGIAGDAEVYHYATRSWEPCSGGRVPDWMDDFTDASLIAFFDTFPSSIAATDAFPGYRYIALGVTNSFHVNGFNGHQDVVAYVLSNDLVNWSPQSVVHSELPYFADGTSYNASVIDPILLQDPAGTLHLYFASADGDADHGIARDGVHDCTVDPNFGPTAIYVGSGIYESVVQPGELAPTDVTITPLAAISGAGQSAGFSIRVQAGDGSLPSGGVSVDSDEWHMTTPIQNGAALVAIPFRRQGTHNVTVTFGTYGPWLNSYSFTTQNVGVPTHKRPGGK